MKLISALSLILSRVAFLQVVWKKWDIPTFLIASFTLQLFLILAAPLRKRSSKWITRVSLWISYLMADWVAAQAIGLILRATEPGCLSVSQAQAYLFSFWAQFLLIHLGGPDTITALALEDNELWLRTALHLGTQAYATLGILFRSTRSSGLWAATLMMFVAGIIKYLERVMSLFHGRLMDARDDNPRYYAKQLLVAKQSDDARLQDTHDMEGQSKRRLTNVEMVRDAFNLFHCHKRLFIDRKPRGGVRRRTRKYMMRRSAEEAYKLMEIELNFAYEAIYTKMKVTQKTSWKILRHIVLLLEVGSLVIWCFTEKRGYPNYDIRITYALVVGAIVVDALAYLRIQLSDWNIAHIIDEKECSKWAANWRIKVYNKLLAVRSGSWEEAVQVDADESSAAATSILIILRSWFRRVFLQRWSESMHQFIVDDMDIVLNLSKCNKFGISMMALFWKLKMAGCCKDEIVAKVSRIAGVKKKGVSSEMWDLIYEEVVRKLDKKRVSNGEELVDLHSLVDTVCPPLSSEKDYVNSLDVWFNLTKSLEIKDDQTAKLISQRQDISTALMRYLMYLMLFQTDMMYGAVGKEELLTVMDDMTINSTTGVSDRISRESSESSDDDGNKEDGPQGVKDMDDLDKILEEVDENEREIVKWELIARVWVKFLCKAAIKCRPDVHAKQLKNGGEFLSFVWLLMVNLGITKL